MLVIWCDGYRQIIVAQRCSVLVQVSSNVGTAVPGVCIPRLEIDGCCVVFGSALVVVESFSCQAAGDIGSLKIWL